MTTITMGIQTLSMVEYIGILLIGAVIWRRWRPVRGLILFPLLWALYGVIYYAFVFAGRFSPDALLLWGAIHRQLASLMVLIGFVALFVILRGQPESDGTD